jgi:hypothetical protein
MFPLLVYMQLFQVNNTSYKRVFFFNNKQHTKMAHTVHTVGDSHCWNGFPPEVSFHWIHSLLCYSFGKDPLGRCDIRKIPNLKHGDSIVFCLGEIDCRCHIFKHVSETLSFQTIIDGIVENYFKGIELNVRLAQKQFRRICVYNIVPPIEKHNTPENPSYPYLGTDNERKEYVLYFNRRLREECAKRNWVFFDVYDKYADSNGFLRKDLSDGNVHIGNGKYLVEFIKTHCL